MLGFYLALTKDNGDKRKFEELYYCYRQDMFKSAYSILKDDREAEDAVHEAFMIVLNKLEKISEIKCPQTRAYLIIIVRNIAFKLYNKRKNAAESLDDNDIEDNLNTEDEVILRIETEKAALLLKQLPENYYQMLYLEQYMGLSISEIAESTGITYENAKKRLQRAKRSFAKLIKEYTEEAF